FFFNLCATSQSYTLSLHDALPIYRRRDVPTDPEGRVARAGGRPLRALVRLRLRVGRAGARHDRPVRRGAFGTPSARTADRPRARSEEHTSELQSRSELVCRLLLEK